ncbi:TM2 domain-containing protein [Pseudidiomarina aquimaris]|uniref:TM2 domain-containing protein n=1 Tax=Pseudidiomarina aquimaris TaxID=641841 RepID=UPI003A96FBE3
MNLEQLQEEEEQLRQQVRELGPEQRKLFYKLQEKQIKDPDTYAVLNYFFVAGLHHFYLRKYLWGSIDLTLMIIGILTFPMGGFVLLILLVLLELPQLFMSQRIVQRYNNQVMRDCLAQARSQTRVVTH